MMDHLQYPLELSAIEELCKIAFCKVLHKNCAKSCTKCLQSLAQKLCNTPTSFKIRSACPLYDQHSSVKLRMQFIIIWVMIVYATVWGGSVQFDGGGLAKVHGLLRLLPIFRYNLIHIVCITSSSSSKISKISKKSKFSKKIKIFKKKSKFSKKIKNLKKNSKKFQIFKKNPNF